MSNAQATVSHNNSTAATNNTGHPTITASQETKVREALTVLHAIVAQRGPSTLPALEGMSHDDLQRLLTRTFTAIVEKDQERFSHLMEQVPTKYEALVQGKRDAANVIVAEFNALSPLMRQMVADKIPTTIVITWAELVGCFPPGAKEADVVKQLSDMKVALLSPKGSKKTTDTFVRLPVAV